MKLIILALVALALLLPAVSQPAEAAQCAYGKIAIVTDTDYSISFNVPGESPADSKTYNKVSGAEDTDWTVFSDIQLKTCLVDWDLQNEKGEVLPVTSDIINNLHANVANALLSKYRQITSLDGDEASD